MPKKLRSNAHIPTAKIYPISDVNGIYIDYKKVGYMVYNLNPPFKTTEDNITVGFKTYSQSGTILDFMTSTGAQWGIKIVSPSSKKGQNI